MDSVSERGQDLLPLRRMATKLGVPSKWLREQAESGQVPGLRAGNRWLFYPDAAADAVRSMAIALTTSLDKLEETIRPCESEESGSLTSQEIDDLANAIADRLLAKWANHDPNTDNHGVGLCG